MTRKKRLGRGLEALLNSTPEPAAAVQAEIAAAPAQPIPIQVNAEEEGTSDIVHLSVYEIEDNPFQPRREFSEPEIVSLAESLKEHDILQPILVRVIDGRHQLISGERRLRAAIHANWQTIPARIKHNVDDRLVSELAIVENLQRKDLNPIEKALSFRRYIDEHNCTQDGLAGRLKIDRSTIANLMRLLELPRKIQEALSKSQLTAGHARALLPLGDEKLQIEFSDRIVAEGMSVRATETAVSDHIATEDRVGVSNSNRKRRQQNSQIQALEQELKLALGTKVSIKKGAGGGGKIVVNFKNHDEFDRIRQILNGYTVKKAA